MEKKNVALSRLRRQLTALIALPRDRNDDAEAFSRWFRATRVAVERTFGDESKQAKEFTNIYFYPPISTEKTTDDDRQWWHESGLRNARRLLEGFIDEIEEYWEEPSGVSVPRTEERAGLSPIKLFISHRSTDRDLARAMASLLRNAMRLDPAEIRCTSVDGYRLPGGADTAAQLREEVLDAAALIGLITPSAMTSAYVLFELGARWGAGKHLCPVLARGADDNMLGGPLGGKNALHLVSRSEVVQMVEEVAAILGRQVDSWTPVQQDIDDVVRLASGAAESPDSTAPASSEPESTIDKTELQILSLLAEPPESRPTDEEIAAELRLNVEKAKFHLRRLATANLIDYVENWGTEERYYFLEQGGRELLVRRGLL